MVDPIEGELADEEAYFSRDDEKRRVLDDKVMQEPISVLKPAEPVCIAESETVGNAIALMQGKRIGCVLVTSGSRLAGIFTERDVLLHVVGKNVDVDTVPVSRMMTEKPETLRSSESIAFALNRMSHGGYRHVPLVDDAGRPNGVVSVKDIVDYLVDFFPTAILNVPPEPGMDVARSREGA